MGVAVGLVEGETLADALGEGVALGDGVVVGVADGLAVGVTVGLAVVLAEGDAATHTGAVMTLVSRVTAPDRASARP